MYGAKFTRRKPPARLISCRSWCLPINESDLMGILEIFYLNKQHPFAPCNWLAHISCCLLWSITSDESDKAIAPLQCRISCTSLNPRSDGMSLSANLSLEIQASQLWHMLKQQQRCDYGMEERCQLLNDPLIYWWKRMRCQNKSGNRLEYIKWCGVSTGLEPILLVSLKLSCLRISSGEPSRVWFRGLWEGWKTTCKQCCVCSKSSLISVFVFEMRKRNFKVLINLQNISFI